MCDVIRKSPHSSVHKLPVCREPSDRSLTQAIRNVKQNYLVVGVMEDFHGFVESLDFLLPDYFRGASNVYEKLGNGRSRLAMYKRLGNGCNLLVTYQRLCNQCSLLVACTYGDYV